MSFNWKELVSLGLINFLHDPELVIHFMKVLMPLRRAFIEDESREFHTSMRMTKSKRWEKTTLLKREGKYGNMNAGVPITFPLPFDGDMWRRSCYLLKSIRYFQYNFIRESLHEGFIAPAIQHVDQNLSGKINTVNLVLDEGLCGINFRSGWSKREVEEALSDFEIFDDWSDDEEPYLLSGTCIDIIN
jgi:hypothetical protein